VAARSDVASLVSRLDRLIQKGQSVAGTRYSNAASFGPAHVQTDAFAEWRSQADHMLTGLLGPDSTYVQRFRTDVTRAGPNEVNHGLGVLRAVKQDAENGDLVDLRTLVAGEVFADFLEMAKHLLEAGYPAAAASVAGAVLEDGLRRIAATNGIVHDPRAGAGTIAGKLVGAGVHSALEQKRLELAIQVRNDADHGNWDQVSEQNTAEISTLSRPTWPPTYSHGHEDVPGHD
jgi:hypothetical protein